MASSLSCLVSSPVKHRNDKKDAELRRKDNRIKELEDERKAAEGKESDELRSARLENHFLRTCISRDDIEDLNSAWDLAEARGFLDSVKDDGEGMEEALSSLCDRYPWLLGDEDEEDGGDQPSRLPKTRHPSAPKSEQQRAANASHLKKRFPALRGRR
jgi:hypothetical protein